jgi:hypothetical protein
MRPSNKSRNRNKNNNRRGTAGNNINRVFDSAGPEGRVRGTPQQIIDKYLSLTYDSQLSGDRVAAENFQQHAEHYSRLLIEAQKELLEKQLEHNATTTNSKPVSKPSEGIVSGAEEPPNVLNPIETKVVSFDKSLEKTINGNELGNAKEKLKKEPTQRKVVKKRGSATSKTIEI